MAASDVPWRGLSLTPEVGAAWLAALRAEASQPVRAPRLPLCLAGPGQPQIGSVEPGFMDQIARLCPPAVRGQLQKEEHEGGGWVLHGEAHETLAALAGVMREAGLAGPWRNEQLAVLSREGLRLATVERAAVRPLGITTHAVHLVGLSPDGRCWVQQRALDKAVDPGRWDTLMGGMVSAQDSLAQALARETWEEAGLVIDQLGVISPGGRVTVRRPIADGGGSGYVIEHIDWFSCTVPESLTPVNQDGEVAQFALLEQADLIERLQRDEFTTEASLIWVAALGLG